VLSGFLRSRSTKPPKPFRGDGMDAGDVAPFALAADLSDGAGFDVAMCHLVQCVEGSRKTLVKFFAEKPKSQTGPPPSMARLASLAVQAPPNAFQSESVSLEEPAA
jgi:hypothetical protein